MDKTYNVSVRDRLAKNLSHLDYVCGNTGYMVRFDFDEEWDAYPIKTARFIESNGEHHDVAVIDNQCEFPQIMNTIRVEVGVYAGDLYTTTPAVIGARRSILSTGGDRPAVPEENEYDKMMEAINQDAVRAENAADEAETAAEEAKKAAEKAVGGGIVVVQITRENGVMKSSHTFRELQDLREKKVLLAMEGARTYTYFGQEGMNLVFANVDYSGGQNNKSLHARRLVISSDDTVAVYSHNNVKVPNPNRLKITGAVSAEYDGSSPVTVNIPEGGDGNGTGLPTGGEPHQMLVTDAEGVAKWEERIIRPPEGETVEVLPECKPMIFPEDAMGIVETPFSETIVIGETYTVYWNDVQYKCVAQPFEEDGQVAPVLGNFGGLAGGEDTGEPFVIVILPEDNAAESGYYAQMIITDGSTEVTLKIEKTNIAYHRLPYEYLPENLYRKLADNPDETYLEETNGELMIENVYAITTPFAKKIVIGEEYTVTFNGESYDLIAEADTTYGEGAAILRAGSGFNVRYLPTPAEIEDGTLVYGQVYAYNVTEAVISIIKRNALIKKVDPVFLPETEPLIAYMPEPETWLSIQNLTPYTDLTMTRKFNYPRFKRLLLKRGLFATVQGGEVKKYIVPTTFTFNDDTASVNIGYVPETTVNTAAKTYILVCNDFYK